MELVSHYQDFLGLGFTETHSTIESLFLRYNLFSKLNMYFSFSIPISIRKCKKSPERSTYYSLIFATCTNNTILFCKIHDFPILYFHLSCSGCTVWIVLVYWPGVLLICKTMFMFTVTAYYESAYWTTDRGALWLE